MRRKLIAVLAATTLGMGAAACGGDDDDQTTVRSPEGQPATKTAGKGEKSLGGAPPGRNPESDVSQR